ncbi:MAG: hypothetical protein GQF41_4201 [Candidatus Rifleibacterium amylolyticum]|nr:MAG: hypothetical protein GQF41_4201 [Candidatus Rifleibacterium amylolyticum]
MQETRQQFYELADSLLRESGLLANRPTWINLRQLIHDASSESLQADCDTLTHTLLLALLSTSEKSAERTGKLGSVIESACRSPLEESFIELLKQLSSDDLTTTLLPQIYCSDKRGSIAVYLAARVGIFIDPEAFQYFLTARPWEQTDLINLAFLVRPAEQLKVSTILEQAAANEGSAINRESFTEFRHILFGQLPQKPLLPDTATIAAPYVYQPPQNKESLNLPALEDQNAVLELQTEDEKSEYKDRSPISAARTKTTPIGNTRKPATESGLSSLLKLIETHQAALFALFLITTIFLMATGISKWFLSDSETRGKPPANAGKLPTYWTDSATREKITERYLAADKDYRMGELYLTRDRYSEALILFEDALNIRPDHTQALYRIGYCRLHIKDYAGAKTALEKALSLDPKFRHANLMLARAAAAQSDNKTAENHFNRELELAKDPSVAEEYANFLHNTGKKTRLKNLSPDIRHFIRIVLSFSAASLRNQKKRSSANEKIRPVAARNRHIHKHCRGNLHSGNEHVLDYRPGCFQNPQFQLCQQCGAPDFTTSDGHAL